MKVGVATKLSMTVALQVMEETCPQRSPLTGTPVHTTGGGAAEGEALESGKEEIELKVAGTVHGQLVNLTPTHSPSTVRL